MPSYNEVTLMGNLTRDPEMKFLQSGTPVTNFSIAMNEKYTNKQTGEVNESVCFVECEAWDRQAEIVNEYVAKGSPIFIKGSLKFDSWETPEGEKRSKLKVRVIRVVLLGNNNNNGDQQYGQSQPTTEAAAPEQTGQSTVPTSDDTTETDDDIPF